MPSTPRSSRRQKRRSRSRSRRHSHRRSTCRETSMQATEPRTGVATREMFYNEALGDALRLEMERDPRVMVLGEDIAEHGGALQGTAGPLGKFGPPPSRRTPISRPGTSAPAG